MTLLRAAPSTGTIGDWYRTKNSGESKESIATMSLLSPIYIAVLFVAIVSILTVQPCNGGIVPELYLDVHTSPNNGGQLAAATLEPRLKLSTQGTLLNDVCDYTGGVTVRTDDNGLLPFSAWGTIQKSISGWTYKARVDTESSNLNDIDFDVQAVGGPTNLLLQASGYISNYRSKAISGRLQNVGVTQAFKLPFTGGKLAVSPAYNLSSKRLKVGLTYDVSENTQLILDANKDQQKFTLSYGINNSNLIVPSITSNGEIAIDYHYEVRDAGLLSTKYRPNDSATFEYKDGPWIASATIPIESYYKLYAKPKFFIRRSLMVE